MFTFTSASEILLRHSDGFKQSSILFAGDIQDGLPYSFICAKSFVHTQFYHHWQTLNYQMGERARFSLVAEYSDISDCDTLIYYWPKNKLQAQFQLMNLLSLMPDSSDIFIVGENRSGVRSSEQMLESWVQLNKIDGARRCSLYHGRLKKQPGFAIETFWSEYQLDKITIKTLPGVFSCDGLDAGSQLLLSTLTTTYAKSKILDVGCGTGVLAAVLASRLPKANLTLCDVSASAIEASRGTLAANGLDGVVFNSNVFSDVIGRYDLIISNPPFHEGTETTLKVTRELIYGAIHHLNSGGELRIVANSFLPYSKFLDETFGFHEIIVQNERFKVYRAIMTG